MGNKTTQERIDYINDLVSQYKAGNMEAGDTLIDDVFNPFILKQCKKWNQLYPGVHEFDSILQEGRKIFGDLLNEYEVGGTAYFNVFIQKKFPLRLRYFFIKEIRHRDKFRCHDDQQFNLYCDSPYIEEDIENYAENEDLKEKINILHQLLDSDLLNDRDKDILQMSIVQGISHKEIGEKYGISRSRVTKIISNTLKKLRKEYTDYYNGHNWEV